MKELDRIVWKGDQQKENLKEIEKKSSPLKNKSSPLKNKSSPLKNDESWLDMSDRPDAELEQSEKYER